MTGTTEIDSCNEWNEDVILELKGVPYLRKVKEKFKELKMNNFKKLSRYKNKDPLSEAKKKKRIYILLNIRSIQELIKISIFNKYHKEEINEESNFFKSLGIHQGIFKNHIKRVTREINRLLGSNNRKKLCYLCDSDKYLVYTCSFNPKKSLRQYKTHN
ncbi:hypothetical protein H8356DRAFT_1354531 [Neocallimastix lanati (nom. inval.)]|nr:hypothetical protein H8356DRAFT_1354531 [Neocallimastix sp. JGI-2020a]